MADITLTGEVKVALKDTIYVGGENGINPVEIDRVGGKVKVGNKENKIDLDGNNGTIKAGQNVVIDGGNKSEIVLNGSGRDKVVIDGTTSTIELGDIYLNGNTREIRTGNTTLSDAGFTSWRCNCIKKWNRCRK